MYTSIQIATWTYKLDQGKVEGDRFESPSSHVNFALVEMASSGCGFLRLWLEVNFDLFIYT